MTKTRKRSDRQDRLEIKDAYVLPAKANPPGATADSRAILDTEERAILFDQIIPPLEAAGVLEPFAGYLVDLRETLTTEAGAQRVFMELNHLLEGFFQRSEAYALAFTLYTGRFELKGTGEPEEVLREVIIQTAPTLIEKGGRRK